jgi:hypothetical protein
MQIQRNPKSNRINEPGPGESEPRPSLGHLSRRAFLSPFKADIRLAYEEYCYPTKAASLSIEYRGEIEYRVARGE